MAQNIYDEPGFVARYEQFNRQRLGLEGAPEWPTVRALLADVGGLRVLDLGCGFGWVSRWAVEQGAAAVVGLDLSERMLDRAERVNSADGAVTYVRGDLATADLATVGGDGGIWDVVHSSLAFHYVADLDDLFGRVFTATAPGATFVFTVEHPVFTAPRHLSMVDAPGGPAWPLNDYGVEGERVRTWLVDGVVKYHRTVGTWLNALIDAGFSVDRVIEFSPTDAQIDQEPVLQVDRDRPPFLIVKATVPC